MRAEAFRERERETIQSERFKVCVCGKQTNETRDIVEINRVARSRSWSKLWLRSNRGAEWNGTRGVKEVGVGGGGGGVGGVVWLNL